jgi:serine/threonine-protein kinase
MTLDIPNYRVVEKLGTGAQTRIFRARCMRSGKDYAVKTVKILKPEDNTIVELMRAEYAIGAAIDSEHIRKVYELRMIRQRLRVRGAILFMEYVDGLTMSDKEFNRPVEEILRLFAEAAMGLHAMHLSGYVHADIKPSNIMVTTDHRVKLIDFGQSARSHEAKQRIQGTIDYMAPEQVQRKNLDPRTDVFGLGATLHRVLTGRPVATEMNQTVNMASQALVGVRRDKLAGSRNGELPKPLARLIADCCAPLPANRPQDMPALIKRLELVADSLNRPASDIPDEEDDVTLDDLHLDSAWPISTLHPTTGSGDNGGSP